MNAVASSNGFKSYVKSSITSSHPAIYPALSLLNGLKHCDRSRHLTTRFFVPIIAEACNMLNSTDWTLVGLVCEQEYLIELEFSLMPLSLILNSGKMKRWRTALQVQQQFADILLRQNGVTTVYRTMTGEGEDVWGPPDHPHYSLFTPMWGAQTFFFNF